MEGITEEEAKQVKRGGRQRIIVSRKWEEEEIGSERRRWGRG